ncbi:hypothetical protein Syun_013143 [Stephania yunnanensis]|uniref:Uncharacterized protein n=1 Tax=Stephania yunnanensis TaxID=152371 RepID=A0AAP0K0S4_9MAGN
MEKQSLQWDYCPCNGRIHFVFSDATTTSNTSTTTTTTTTTNTRHDDQVVERKETDEESDIIDEATGHYLTLSLAPAGSRIPTRKLERKVIVDEEITDIDEATGLDVKLRLGLPLPPQQPPQHQRPLLLIGFNNNIVPPPPPPPPRRINGGNEPLFTIVKTLQKSDVGMQCRLLVGTKMMEDNVVNPFFTEEQKREMCSEHGLIVSVRDVDEDNSSCYSLTLKRLVKSSNSLS